MTKEERNSVIEECAKRLDLIAKNWLDEGGPKANVYSLMAEMYAESVRKLKED